MEHTLPQMSHRLPLLGGEVDALTPASMLAATEAFVAGGGTAVIANHNLHSLALLATQPRLRDFFLSGCLREFRLRGVERDPVLRRIDRVEQLALLHTRAVGRRLGLQPAWHARVDLDFLRRLNRRGELIRERDINGRDRGGAHDDAFGRRAWWLGPAARGQRGDGCDAREGIGREVEERAVGSVAR